LHLISPPYTLSNYINIHTNDCIHIQCICIYVSIVSHASNEYVLYIWLHTFVSIVLQMHPMHMCIHFDCIDCFANAFDAYVYTYDCTHLYRLFCKCIQCICVYIWLHRFVSIVTNASNEYVYKHYCTHSYRLFCICIQCICVYIWFHMCWIDCCICIIQCINVYVWLHTFVLIVLHMHLMHMCIPYMICTCLYLLLPIHFLFYCGKKQEKVSVCCIYYRSSSNLHELLLFLDHFVPTNFCPKRLSNCIALVEIS